MLHKGPDLLTDTVNLIRAPLHLCSRVTALYSTPEDDRNVDFTTSVITSVASSALDTRLDHDLSPLSTAQKHSLMSVCIVEEYREQRGC